MVVFAMGCRSIARYLNDTDHVFRRGSATFAETSSLFGKGIKGGLGFQVAARQPVDQNAAS
jgi:hypothetical protein